mmetsp:Transcript_9538/g.12541  ORF Transcript_9538/g.12541 Transcript_9538/m.12541 type:complete len:841 (+) Transcript_9538:138-2660(+)|eukprot:CAMPEP_0117742620 /NCGR_PEP_ID=MMETSP0947-20121206/5651_1 /TAXON_ID=44440 /ORGANISM="Chattonella subsalsa, Strain CCMP2191" /LENGTH=840 /DNA_ID=CAMNT_0005559171 /DNA_START=111 /DNA_END=2633 /DNA_ORIENTATION=-
MELFRSIKNFAKRIGHGIENASEYVAQSQHQDRLDEFKFRYRSFLETVNILGSQKLDAETGAALLAESRVKDHVKGVIRVLIEEDHANTAVDASLTDALGVQTQYPCMEYFFEERVMRSLCELGIADQPIGTMSLVLGTAAALMMHIQYPLLPSQHVHYPISELITAAMYYQQVGVRRRGGALSPNADFARAMVQKNLVSLVAILWRRLREDLAQLDFFLYVDPLGIRAPRLDIFDAVLPYVTAGGDIGVLARQAVLMALSLQSKRVELYVVYHTDFCLQLAMHLAGNYSLLPRSLEVLQAKHGVQGSPRGNRKSKDAKAQGDSLPPEPPSPATAATARGEQEIVAEFFRHLKFCNAVNMAVAHSPIQSRENQSRKSLDSSNIPQVEAEEPQNEKILGKGHQHASVVDGVWDEIQKHFLEKSLQQDLLKPFGLTFQAALAYTAQMIVELNHDWETETPFLQRFLGFLFLGKNNQIRNQLVRCLDVMADPNMRLSALSLMSIVLKLQNKKTLKALLLADEDVDELTSEIEEDTNFCVSSELCAEFCSRFPHSPLDPQGGKKSVESDKLYQDYVEESRRQVILSSISRTHQKPRRKINASLKRLVRSPGREDEVGPPSKILELVDRLDQSNCLLHSLFNRLERFFDSKLDENVLLTEIFSKLIRESMNFEGTPHLYGVFHALFDTKIESYEGTHHRTMSNILHTLWTEARRKYETTPQANTRTQLIRYTLGIDAWSTSKKLMAGRRPTGSESASPFLENYVLLEEFLKEILSILQAKMEFAGDLDASFIEKIDTFEDEEVEEHEESSTQMEPDFDLEVFERDMKEEIRKLEQEFISETEEDA